MMRTDAVVRQEGFRALIDRLGHVDAERFIVLVNREPFDYTEWRRDHLDDQGMSIRELSAAAEAYAAELRGRKDDAP